MRILVFSVCFKFKFTFITRATGQLTAYLQHLSSNAHFHSAENLVEIYIIVGERNALKFCYIQETILSINVILTTITQNNSSELHESFNLPKKYYFIALNNCWWFGDTRRHLSKVDVHSPTNTIYQLPHYKLTKIYSYNTKLDRRLDD